MTTRAGPLCRKCNRPQQDGKGWETFHKGSFKPEYEHGQCPEQVCLKTVNRGDHRLYLPQPCGRDGKELVDDEWLCGIHLAALRRREAAQQAFANAQDGSSDNAKRARTACDILAELDIAASPHYHSDPTSIRQSGYTGRIVVDPQELFRALGIGVTLPATREYRQ